MRTLYAGGFLIAPADREPALPDDQLRELVGAWRCTRVGRYAVRYDETWRANHAVAGDAEALLLGTAMDLDAPERSQQDALDSLVAALSVSDAAFLDRLDALVGAHVVVARRGGTHWVLQDATGMEGVAYDTGGEGPLVASHPALIADIRGYEMSALGALWVQDNPDPEAQKHKFWQGSYHTPGVTSPYERVRALTPNTRLDLDTGSVERFFPRDPIGVLDMDTVVERVAGHLTDVFGWVTREFAGRASVSISGGMDSRLTLAASRPYAAQLRYFTYFWPEHATYRNDVRVARTLAQRLGLDHRAWRLAPGPELAATAADWRRTHRGIHGAGANEYSYAANIPPGDLHIRSNVLEAVRGVYLKHPGNRNDEFDAARLARLFRPSAGDRFVPEYEQFIAVTGFTPEAKRDMHFTDLYHWEQRLGRWHMEVLRRSKISHNTFTIWNARRILKLMLSRPAEDRWNARVVYRLMEAMWPEVLETPVFSGAKYVAPPADLPVAAAAFSWGRLAPEIRLAFARALGLEVAGGDAGAAARALTERMPAPTADDFTEPLVEAALADWLPADPAALDHVYAHRVAAPRANRPARARERVARIDRQRARPAGLPLRRSLVTAVLAAGGRLPAIADRSALRPYLRVPTTGLNATPLEAHEEALLGALRAHGDEPVGGLVAVPPAGGGRRVVARWLLEDGVRAGRKVLWITQRVELLEQAALAFVEGAALLRERAEPLVMRLSGGAYGPRELSGLATEGPDVTVATMASLARNGPALEALLRDHEVIVAVDQAHHAAAPAWRETLARARAGARAVVGLVPAEAPGAGEALGGDVLARAGLRELIEAGALAVPRPVRVETGAAIDAGLALDALGDLASGGLSPRVQARLAEDDARNERVVGTWLEGRRAGRYGPTVAFAVDPPHARALTERLVGAGVSAEWVSPLRPDRLAVFDRFRSGRYDVLLTAGPVPEGIHLPRVDTVLLCRPTRSDGLLAELCAVAMRGPAAGGTEAAHLVTFADRWEHLTGWLDAGDVYGTAGDQGVYDFEVEIALTDDETEIRRHVVAATVHQLAGYDALAAAAAAAPAGLPPASRLREEHFAGLGPPLPAVQDLALLRAYAGQRGAMPPRGQAGPPRAVG